MSVKRALVAAAALFVLAGCGVNGRTPAPTTSATLEPLWAPAGMTAYGAGLAWEWTPTALVDCKVYQDGCYGITVATQYGCPNGIFIEVSILDASGASIDKANDITAGLSAEGTAKSVLSPPGGAPKGAKAKLTRLNCLGD